VGGNHTRGEATWRRYPACLLGALLVLALPSAASAQTTRYAEPGGTGEENVCAQSDPCSLDDAVEDDSVVDGDEVIVLPGTYDDLAGDGLLIADRINLHGAHGGPRPLITESTAVTTISS
jgi:hypothetical protein